MASWVHTSRCATCKWHIELDDPDARNKAVAAHRRETNHHGYYESTRRTDAR